MKADARRWRVLLVRSVAAGVWAVATLLYFMLGLPFLLAGRVMDWLDSLRKEEM